MIHQRKIQYYYNLIEELHASGRLTPWAHAHLRLQPSLTGPFLMMHTTSQSGQYPGNTSLCLSVTRAYFLTLSYRILIYLFECQLLRTTTKRKISITIPESHNTYYYALLLLSCYFLIVDLGFWKQSTEVHCCYQHREIGVRHELKPSL